MRSSYDQPFNSPIHYTPLRIFQLNQIYRRRAFKQNILMASVFVLLAIVSGYFFLYNQKDNLEYVQAASNIPASPVMPTIIPVTPTLVIQNVEPTPTVFVSLLHTVVEKELEGTKGTYGVVVKNLKTGESYYFNEHKKFQTASLYKVWIMAVVYEQIKKGIISEDEVLQSDVAKLNERFNIATEDAELKEGTVTFTVHNALEEMIRNSSNYAALLLSARINLSNVAKFLSNNNLRESSIGQPPQTTASDMALFFEKLYNGEITDPEYTQKMIDLLKRQNLNNVLPKYIPAGVPIAHKTGQIFSVAHDAGIFYLEDTDYIIVGMSDSDFYPDAQERIARVSQAVYTYFTEK